MTALTLRGAQVDADAPPTYRILVTGARDWSDDVAVAEALLEARDTATRGAEIVLVHGDCQTGADAIAKRWATTWGWIVEDHPADWERYRNAAGYRRNAEMVNLGADICLAFIRPCVALRCRGRLPRHDSHGTAHCAGLARSAGILVIEVRGPEMSDPPERLRP